MMLNCNPRDRFVYPYLTRIMDSFSCTLDFHNIYLEKLYPRFEVKRFDVIVTCALSDNIMCRPIQPMLKKNTRTQGATGVR